MGAERIVERLEFCRQSGPGQWMARCPAHEDRGPSLSIKDDGGGRTLIHCFAGCGAIDVLAAIGLDLNDLYPPTDRNYHAERKQRERSVDELVADIALADIAAGRDLSSDDIDRATDALKRLETGEPSPSPDPNVLSRNVVAVGTRESERVKKGLEVFK